MVGSLVVKTCKTLGEVHLYLPACKNIFCNVVRAENLQASARAHTHTHTHTHTQFRYE